MLGVKRGMTQVFDEAGNCCGVSVVELKPEFKADTLQAGDFVDVSGLSIGKGFAGRIKRWHQHRGPMSHGSKCHRIPGSIGSGTTPGRVWKGKQMPGRLGGGKITNKRLKIIQILAAKNVLLIYGSVPGKRGNEVMIRKAK